MVKGGKSELHQIIKKVIYESTHTIEDNTTCNINTIKKKPPNNSYLLGKYSFCEVMHDDLSLDINYDLYSLCRVYTKSVSLFIKKVQFNNSYEIIDSQLIHAYTNKYDSCIMKTINNSRLHTSGILLKDILQYSVIFMALLHDLNI